MYDIIELVENNRIQWHIRACKYVRFQIPQSDASLSIAPPRAKKKKNRLNNIPL